MRQWSHPNSVDAAVNRHAIDPRIYGVAFADSATMTDLDIPINRWGGNTTSRYNCELRTAVVRCGPHSPCPPACGLTRR